MSRLHEALCKQENPTHWAFSASLLAGAKLGLWCRPEMARHEVELEEWFVRQLFRSRALTLHASRSLPKEVHQLPVHFVGVSSGYAVRPILHYQ